MGKEPKYQIGQSVIVCQTLKTKIEKVVFHEKQQEYIYFFRDEEGKLWEEVEYAIENKHSANFNAKAIIKELTSRPYLEDILADEAQMVDIVEKYLSQHY